MLKAWFPVGSTVEKCWDHEGFDLMNGLKIQMASQFEGTIGRLWERGGSASVEEVVGH